ncbi:MAG: hypothetical protein KGZ63_05840 [Clostridiales bacterium]|jgi:ethanolamine utilization protein EutQ|nr:hypothetical protein [Clostridiales bacterium]
MKKLISTETIKQYQKNGESQIAVDANTIITCAARDLASELDICFVSSVHREESPAPEPCMAPKPEQENTDLTLVSLILQKVLEQLNISQACNPVIEADISGFRLVHSNADNEAVCKESSNSDKVTNKDIITVRDGIKAGFISINSTNYTRLLNCQEVNYVIEGNLEVIIGDKTFSCRAGDVLILPQDKELIFSSSDCVKMFYVTC